MAARFFLICWFFSVGCSYTCPIRMCKTSVFPLKTHSYAVRGQTKLNAPKMAKNVQIAKTIMAELNTMVVVFFHSAWCNARVGRDWASNPFSWNGHYKSLVMSYEEINNLCHQWMEIRLLFIQHGSGWNQTLGIGHLVGWPFKDLKSTVQVICKIA